jgi:hypothetical protein
VDVPVEFADMGNDAEPDVLNDTESLDRCVMPSGTMVIVVSC